MALLSEEEKEQLNKFWRNTPTVKTWTNRVYSGSDRDNRGTHGRRLV